MLTHNPNRHEMSGADTYMQEDPDPNLFATEVRNCAGSSLTLEIWSAKVLECWLTCLHENDI